MALSSHPQLQFHSATNVIHSMGRKWKGKAHLPLFIERKNAIVGSFQSTPITNTVFKEKKDGPPTSVEVCARDLLHNMDSILSGQLDLSVCKEAHHRIVTSGLEHNVHLGSKLVSMYASCGRVEDARQVFVKMSQQQDVVLWTAMMNGYTRNGLYQEALTLYFELNGKGMQPNHITCSSALKACAGLCALEQGKHIHAHIIKLGFVVFVNVGGSLVDMYAKCGKIEIARQVFDKMCRRNVVSWNTIIMGFAQNGEGNEAVKYFNRMLYDNVKPNSNVLVSILKVCKSMRALNWGKEIHAQVMKKNLQSDVFLGSGLVAMYSQCNRLEAARRVFDRISQRNVVLWNAMITAYSQSGFPDEALKLFLQMQGIPMKPSSTTIVGILGACGRLASLKQGKQIHGYIIRNKLESNVFVGSALIALYAKVAYLGFARKVLDKNFKRHVRLWTAMIAGYGMNGQHEEAIKCFHQMQMAGLKPNNVTFVTLLSICSHSGLVTEGWQYFNSMYQDYHIKPRVEHYKCMVELLGRAGRIREAYDFIQNMPIEPDSDVQEALLVACKSHSNVELGENVSRHLFEIDPENSRNYVLLLNIYAEAGRWSDLGRVRKMMEERGLQGLGCRWIDDKSVIRSFILLAYLSLVPTKSIFLIIARLLVRSFLKLLLMEVL